LIILSPRCFEQPKSVDVEEATTQAAAAEVENDNEVLVQKEAASTKQNGRGVYVPWPKKVNSCGHQESHPS
jgi:hypothetical protein